MPTIHMSEIEQFCLSRYILYILLYTTGPISFHIDANGFLINKKLLHQGKKIKAFERNRVQGGLYERKATGQK